MSPSRLKPATLRSKQDLVLHLPVALRDFIFLSFLAPWYCGREVGSLRDLDVVAFFVAWLALDQQPELNPSKRQHPTAWVTFTARRRNSFFMPNLALPFFPPQMAWLGFSPSNLNQLEHHFIISHQIPTASYNPSRDKSIWG